MKAIWTGSIGFGLVNIPIKLFSAIQTSNLDFDMLDKKDLANIKFKRVNANSNKEVLWENIVKGFMLDGKYVVLDDKDFAKASPEKSEHIEILQFADEKEIDSIYFESPYYVQPQKAGTRAYALLKEALKKSGKVGLGSFVMREREHICIIRAKDELLVLNRLRFPQEIRDTSELNISTAASKPVEVKMAISLIEQLTKPFDPSNFKDEYTAKLMTIIKAKSRGKNIPFKPLKIVHSKSIDLMDQLKASLSPAKKKITKAG